MTDEKKNQAKGTAGGRSKAQTKTKQAEAKAEAERADQAEQVLPKDSPYAE